MFEWYRTRPTTIAAQPHSGLVIHRPAEGSSQTTISELGLDSPASAVQLGLPANAFEVPRAGERPSEPVVFADQLVSRLRHQHGPRSGRASHPARHIDRTAEPVTRASNRRPARNANTQLGQVCV